MSDSSPRSISLVMRQGPQPNQAFPLDKDTLTLGRALDNDVVIEDSEVSRHHARLTRQGDVWVLEDLNSRNGTTFNGQRITGPVVLTPGSQLGLGPDVVFGAQEGIPAAAGETLSSQARSAGETLPPTPVPHAVSPTAPTASFQTPPPAGKGSSSWPILAGAAAVVLLVLACVAALAFYYLKPVTLGPSAEAELPSEGGPFVAFKDPSPGTRVDQGDSVLVFATARDADKVTRMDLWLDDKLMVQQTSPDPDGVNPLSLIHSLVADEPGTHDLTVRAYNGLAQMGESPPINLMVLEADEDETIEPEPSLYVVQKGDTLESIAKKLGSTVAAIKKANPTLGSTVKEGQIISVPLQKGVIAPPQAPVAGKKTPQAQAWAGKQGKQTPPAKDGQKTLVKPPQQQAPKIPRRNIKGPAPIWDPNKPKQGGAPGAPLPSDPPKDQKISKVPILPPVLEKPVVGDCKVTLKWQDRLGATRFRIKRWSGSPLKLAPPMESKAKDTFEDKVPGPGTYWYTVVAEKGSGEDKVSKESNRVRADVAKSASCVGEPKYKQIYFQPLDVDLKADYKRAALFININKIAERRIPDTEGQYLPPGGWKERGKEVYPAPSSLYLDEDEEVVLWVAADACPSKAAPNPKILKVDCDDLPAVEKRYSAKDLTGKEKQRLTAEGQDFTASYRLWLDDVQWTGKETTKDSRPQSSRWRSRLPT